MNILSVKPDGSVSVKYSKGNTTEDTNLNSINWMPVSGRGKCLPLKPPQAHASTCHPKLASSQAHKVKGFADDLTVLSSSKEEYEVILLDVDSKCMQRPRSIKMCIYGLGWAGSEKRKLVAYPGMYLMEHLHF